MPEHLLFFSDSNKQSVTVSQLIYSKMYILTPSPTLECTTHVLDSSVAELLTRKLSCLIPSPATNLPLLYYNICTYIPFITPEIYLNSLPLP